jgi:YHS domain-containing protein
MVLGGLLTLILVFLALVSFLAYYNQPAPAPQAGRLPFISPQDWAVIHNALLPPEPGAADQKLYYWTCSMHPEVKSDKPGNCPKCGMTLAPVGEAATAPTPVTQKLCPVTGDPIDPKIHVDYNRRRIYFCCEMCPPIFRKDPEKYLKKLDEQMGMKTQAADDAKPAATNPPLEPSHAGKGAHVTAVDNDAKTASIDLGSEDGVAEGMAFMIYNAAEKRYLATLTIKIVSKKSAAGDLSVIRGAIKVNYSAARIPNS